MSLISLQAEKQKREPHIRGNARCLQCEYEWEAVASVGVNWLECPKCHTDKGCFRVNVYPGDGLILECQCGNELFLYTPDGPFCPNCGLYPDVE